MSKDDSKQKAVVIDGICFHAEAIEKAKKELVVASLTSQAGIDDVTTCQQIVYTILEEKGLL